jgi:hypothetical protein
MSSESRLHEAEAHLWALVVWFGVPQENPYVARDMAAAAAYVERHLKGEDMTARHREVMRAFDVEGGGEA